MTAQRELIGRVMKEEEDSFFRTLDKGITLLNGAMDELKAHGKTELMVKRPSVLFDTHGSHSICQNLSAVRMDTVDEKQFNEEMATESACSQCCCRREW